MDLSNLTFAAPWALAGLLLLPIIWQLLRVTPPKPTKIQFPAVRLLQELNSAQVLSTKTPWWVLVLRSLIIIALIAAMAQPIMNANQSIKTGDAPLVIVVDNDWSVMDRWDIRKTEIRKILDRAEKNDLSVVLVATADNDDLRIENTQRQRAHATTLMARPWQTNRDETLARLKNIVPDLTTTPQIIWLSNGLLEHENDTFLKDLQALGEVTYIHETGNAAPIAIQKIDRLSSGLDITLSGTAQVTPLPVEINILDEDANVLDRQSVTFTSGSSEHKTTFKLPAELRREISSIRIGGLISPASQYLIDEKWRDRPVGIVEIHASEKNLLAPDYYIRKSLRPHASLYTDNLDDLLKRKMALIIDVNQTTFTAEQNQDLLNWVERGGLFIRFAAPTKEETTSKTIDPLMPVTLLNGERTLGGALSWKRASGLATFPEHSPFNALPTPKDIVVKKQVLARPEIDLAPKTWAQLSDGTPLITAKQIGEGWSILFHIASVPGWSNIPLSGTFELMMMRLLTISAGSDFPNKDKLLLPYRIFNNTGTLIPAAGQAKSLNIAQMATAAPNADHPPGLYGTQKNLRAYNLGPSIKTILPLGPIPTDVKQSNFEPNKEQPLAPWLLLIALTLALIDWVITIGFFRISKTATAALLLSLLTFPVQAETDWSKAMAAANNMRLAYMQTGDKQLDQTVLRGLEGLSSVLKRRTAVELSQTMAFDPEKDDPALFPMIYWAISENQEPISKEAAAKLNRFLKTGGFILLDTMGQKNPDLLAHLTEHLDINELRPVPNNHVLTRSFYLMRTFPGRYAIDEVWVEASENSNRDRVSSVLIGNNSWAEAWARDENFRPMYAVVPGGESQREQAYRFGVNLVMYILSGNYKGDQVHLPAILQRLGL